ncbi:MAG TPA: KUP/HAK/KT family potassium transporter [Opitutaceae bacterium]
MSNQPGFEGNATRSALALGALGVVFGDIGTSPLYTIRECVKATPDAGEAGILGVLSLVTWALILVVSVKYVMFVTRANNRGEGGIFALLALGHPDGGRGKLRFGIFVILIGATLLYGEGVITPAISVLSAAEGFAAVRPEIAGYVPLIAVVVLAVLFWFQHKGTHAIGRIYGPIIFIWFATLAVLGVKGILTNPSIIRAINPVHAWDLVMTHPAELPLLLGSVILAITGVEALYADMGHFGRRAIQLTWYAVVLPGLLLNYYGQGAHALAHPEDVPNLFFSLAPEGLPRLLLVLLSVVATIIASQALISGAFSLTRQAVQLGFFPRVKILHTSAEVSGQIFIPIVNRFLAVGSILTVIGFQSSANLAAAYGLAVAGAMLMTTLAFYTVTRRHWGWPLVLALPLCGLFLFVDGAFLYANAHKIADGGWLPLVIGIGILLVMHTWKRGREVIAGKIYGRGLEDVSIADVITDPNIHRVPGTAVFMASTARGTPLALLHHLKATRSLQKTVIILSIVTEEVPAVAEENRITFGELGGGAWRVVGRYGYMESPDVEDLMRRLASAGVDTADMTTTFFFNREMILTDGDTPLWQWQKEFYGFLSRNARPARDYYRISPSQIIEIGMPVQL